jgi:hypothetical protein
MRTAGAATIDDSIAEGLMLLGGDLAVAVERELRFGAALELELAMKRQARIAQANHRNPRRMIDGMGQVTMSIDPVLRLHAERQYGKGCFKDKQFCRELLRDNPELRVPVAKGCTIIRP